MNGNNNNKLNKISIKTISERECSQSSAIEVCPVLEEAPYHIVLLCYLSYVILILFGYLRDFLRNTGIEKNKTAVENNREVIINSISDCFSKTCYCFSLLTFKLNVCIICFVFNIIIILVFFIIHAVTVLTVTYCSLLSK